MTETMMAKGAETSRLAHQGHVPVATAHAVHQVMRPLSTDTVVVPAKNESANILQTIRYLLSAGFAPSQILVLINGTTDDTLQVVQRVGGLNVRCQDEVLERHQVHDKAAQLNLPRELLRGKGTAMFAAALVLNEMGHGEAARVLFLDADITNVAAVDPVQRLLHGWEQQSHARLIKLAAQGRNNEGMHAFFGIPGCPFADLGCLQWPLCGQMSLRWGDLRTMRLTTGYSVEVTMMVDLIKRYIHNEHQVLAEVAISETLRDKQNHDGVHVRMYRTIMALLQALWLRGGRSTTELTQEEAAAFNQEQHESKASFWVPQPPGHGANKREVLPLDLVLPTVAECF